ncbi:hypothetical protein ONS95_001535 [Cadophora gregata]|uniref:uncharacterized protein n=1 Tax=Cadophora gregata TaxID=51156 RepID=UPI0026DC52BD|nr:uncharacterized protein ONS95_001535 [Cadophora gregata]KAK0111158.1 hypothetical protein ONS95_001535 [Cadophora gregata]KAK0112375.1 hypothetical protein ONS96_001618 [Cadophora gregata f. sp. sojae]
MKFTPITSVALMALTLVNPGSASIGKAASLACDLFCDGIASLFIEIFTKRDLNGNLVPMEERSYIKGKRQSTPGVPQEEFERCHNDLAGLTVTVTSPAAGQVQFDDVPASCMNLATVLVGDPVEGPYVQPCGSACLSYYDLTEQQFNDLVAALQAI